MRAICIKCWDEDALVTMHLDGSDTFECAECGEKFSCSDVRDTLRAMRNAWEKLLVWAEAYPKDDAEPKA